jgi:hypothetical protein
MDSLRFQPSPPCFTLLHPAIGPPLKHPYGCFRGGSPKGWSACGRLPRFGHPTAYAAVRRSRTVRCLLRDLIFETQSNYPKSSITKDISQGSPHEKLLLSWVSEQKGNGHLQFMKMNEKRAHSFNSPFKFCLDMTLPCRVVRRRRRQGRRKGSE